MNPEKETADLIFVGIGKSIILPDNEATRGQIRQVGHLLKVEEV